MEVSQAAGNRIVLTDSTTPVQTATSAATKMTAANQ